MKFMIPLAVTYFAQYLISQGLAEFSIFDCDHGFGLDIRSQYRWYQVISQLGVFITRSSVSFFQLPVFLLILLPFLEVCFLNSVSINLHFLDNQRRCFRLWRFYTLHSTLMDCICHDVATGAYCWSFICKHFVSYPQDGNFWVSSEMFNFQTFRSTRTSKSLAWLLQPRGTLQVLPGLESPRFLFIPTSAPDMRLKIVGNLPLDSEFFSRHLKAICYFDKNWVPWQFYLQILLKHLSLLWSTQFIRGNLIQKAELSKLIKRVVYNRCFVGDGFLTLLLITC